jgi:hypothetical protein
MLKSFKINDSKSNIKIEYGHDDIKGIYLKAYCEQKHEDILINKEFLNLFTGESDRGEKISKQEMIIYFEKYAISNDQIDELLHLPECNICKKETNNSCSQCHAVFYCSSKCQSIDFKIHKFFCSSLPFPLKINEKNSVAGVFLSEYSPEPILVQVPIHFEVSGSSIFFKEYPTTKLFMQANPLKASKIFKDTLIFEYQECFSDNFSIEENSCVKHLTNNKNPTQWRGPILITKHEGLQSWAPFHNYLDITINDFSNIVDFFLTYVINEY